MCIILKHSPCPLAWGKALPSQWNLQPFQKLQGQFYTCFVIIHSYLNFKIKIIDYFPIICFPFYNLYQELYLFVQGFLHILHSSISTLITSGTSSILQKFLMPAYFKFIGSHFPTSEHWAKKDVMLLVGWFSGNWVHEIYNAKGCLRSSLHLFSYGFW